MTFGNMFVSKIVDGRPTAYNPYNTTVHSDALCMSLIGDMDNIEPADESAGLYPDNGFIINLFNTHEIIYSAILSCTRDNCVTLDSEFTQDFHISVEQVDDIVREIAVAMPKIDYIIFGRGNLEMHKCGYIKDVPGENPDDLIYISLTVLRRSEKTLSKVH